MHTEVRAAQSKLQYNEAIKNEEVSSAEIELSSFAVCRIVKKELTSNI